MLDGAAIKAAREARDLRQEDVAGTLGVSDVTIWRWEAGRTKNVDYPTARRLADALGVPVDALYVHDAQSATAPVAAGRISDESPANER